MPSDRLDPDRAETLARHPLEVDQGDDRTGVQPGRGRGTAVVPRVTGGPPGGGGALLDALGRAEQGGQLVVPGRGLVGAVDGDPRAEVHGVEDRLLLHLGEDGQVPGEAPAAADAAGGGVHGLRRQHVVLRDVVVHRQTQLLEVVDALGAAGRLTGRLHGRQQQRDQDRDDRDHDEQFDERKSTMSSHLNTPEKIRAWRRCGPADTGRDDLAWVCGGRSYLPGRKVSGGGGRRGVALDPRRRRAERPGGMKVGIRVGDGRRAPDRHGSGPRWGRYPQSVPTPGKPRRISPQTLANVAS